MQLRLGFEMAYYSPQPMSMLMALNVHQSRRADLIRPDTIVTDPEVTIAQYHDQFGNLCTRMVAPGGNFTVRSDALIEDDGELDAYAPEAQQVWVDDLPESTLMYLLGSRYCETDLLSPIAWQLFGSGPTGWGRVQAVCDFVHQHITFGYQHARRTRTAYEAYNEGRGVCRDYAHLAVAFCRCLNIPARYCSGYLSDVGEPPPYAEMDFAGWFEAYLGDRWYTFDPRNNRRRRGRILMTTGRDATDVALSNTFGPNTLTKFKVWIDEVKEA
jgi:transglutaminase-like putative cysteine protease